MESTLVIRPSQLIWEEWSGPSLFESTVGVVTGDVTTTPILYVTAHRFAQMSSIMWDQASISSSICREWQKPSHSMCAPGYTACREWCKIQGRRQGYNKGVWLEHENLELSPKGTDLVSGKAGNGHQSTSLYPAIPPQSIITLLAVELAFAFQSLKLW